MNVIEKSSLKPFVSVLMSVYNAEKYLREAIESILNQTFKNFEFIIINDSSTDSSLSIINSYKDERIKLVDNNENLGLTKSLNIGLEIAKGLLIARQDADDISHLARLQMQVDYFNNYPELDILGTQANYILEDGRIFNNFKVIKPLTHNAIKFSLTYDSPFIHSSVMFKKQSIWGQLNGYSKLFRTSQDFELWSRASNSLVLRNINEVLLTYRFVGSSISSNYKASDVHKLSQIYYENCLQCGFDKYNAKIFVSFIYSHCYRKPLEIYNYNQLPKFLYKHIYNFRFNDKYNNTDFKNDLLFYVQTLLLFSKNSFYHSRKLSIKFLFYSFVLSPTLVTKIVLVEFFRRISN